MPVDPLTIGPDDGTLTLHTGVEGKAAKAGHALTLRITDWSATVTLDGVELSAVTVRAAVGSIEVVEGHGGVKPLSDRDKRSVISSAMDTLSADKYPEVAFASQSITSSDDGYDVAGEATLCGQTGAVAARLAVQRAGGRVAVDATIPIQQTAFGIKPYSGMLGALRVSDQVEVRMSLSVPEPG